ncbi:alpha/beta hydrolase [Saccharopolyspora rosea]|uniref:Alpha/beta hydrolase n=1 Tax=Saccharopolyspora rosea TaxID=524884 RepID=A0ABW3FLN7_9PSEU
MVWEGYESPNSLVPGAAEEHYARGAEKDLADFQQGLRVTHDGPPSHNTVLGHSYGSTVVGYASRDHGLHADDIAFLGSPGVGVEHAGDLGVPADHVWAGTSRDDAIHLAASPDPTTWGGSPDQHWYGMNPADPAFGGNQIPSNPRRHET